jgi:hypothetical protein
MYRATHGCLWEKLLDFNVQATCEGELEMLLSRFVRSTEPTKTPGATFAQILQLSTELQFCAISCCDILTLYQLMHTSRNIRVEARKLFITNPGA